MAQVVQDQLMTVSDVISEMGLQPGLLHLKGSFTLLADKI